MLSFSCFNLQFIYIFSLFYNFFLRIEGLTIVFSSKANNNLRHITCVMTQGTFNSLNGKLSRSEEESPGEESEGFYIAKAANGALDFIKIHKLIDLINFTEILNYQELANIQDIIEKNKKKAREESLNYEFTIHELHKEGDEFIMLAEAYYPEYRQVSTISYDFLGRRMPHY